MRSATSICSHCAASVPSRACAAIAGQARRSATVEQRALAELEIEVVVADNVPETRTAAAREVVRHGCLQLADSAVHARGDAPLGALKEFGGTGKRIGHGKIGCQIRTGAIAAIGLHVCGGGAIPGRQQCANERGSPRRGETVHRHRDADRRERFAQETERNRTQRHRHGLLRAHNRGGACLSSCSNPARAALRPAPATWHRPSPPARLLLVGQMRHDRAPGRWCETPRAPSFTSAQRLRSRSRGHIGW